MTPAQFQNLNEHIQVWCVRSNMHAPDVAGALVEMAAQNAVHSGVTRKHWRDQCAEAFARAQGFVRRGRSTG